MQKAKVVGKVNLASVIKVKNKIELDVSEQVAKAAIGLRRNRVAAVDMSDRYVLLRGGERKLGLKLLTYLDTLVKAGYTVIRPA